MMNWIIVEINGEGTKRALEGEYTNYDEACEVQEALEWLHDENCYLIYTNDEWVYEGEKNA